MGNGEDYSGNFQAGDDKMNFRKTIKSLEEVRKTLQRIFNEIIRRDPGYGTAFPSVPTDGKIFSRTDTKITYQYQNGAWVDISTGGGGGTPPTNYLLWMDGTRAEFMDGTDFELMESA
jgi:hypothetical protein